MRKTIFMLAGLISLAGCATPIDTGYINRMNGFVGKSEHDLIYAWGVPNKTYDTETGPRILTYTRANQQIMGGGLSGCAGSVFPGYGFNNCVGTMPAEAVTYYCDFSFNLLRGRVTGWFQNGNDCPRIK